MELRRTMFGFLFVLVIFQMANGWCWRRRNFRRKFGNSTRRKSPTTTTDTTTTRTTTTTITTTTATTKSNESANLIRRRYESARLIMNPVLYGFTQADADSFQSRINDKELTKNIEQNCTRRLPFRTQYKIEELNQILTNTQCINKSKKSLKEKRRRRNTQGGNVKGQRNNDDGSVTLVRNCLNRGTCTKNGNVRLCTECQAITVMPNDVFPRFINEVICDRKDDQCFSGTGSCSEGMVTIPFLRDVRNVGLDRLGEWHEYAQSIRTSCSCGISVNSPFRFFV